MLITREIIHTADAPSAVGTYSQAIKVGNTVYISGQIPLDPERMVLVSSDFSKQVHRVFQNVQAVCHASGADLADIVKLTIYLTDLSHFATVNDIMEIYFQAPYPARAAIGVAALPKDSLVEMDAIVVLGARCA